MADSDDKSPSKLAAIEKRAKRMEAKLRRDYKIGLRALKVKKPLRKTFAGRNGLSEDTLRKLRAFAENYTEDELDELCALRRKGSGLPLHFGYVIYLLAAQSAARRACVAAMEAKKPDGKGKVDHEKARRAGKRARAGRRPNFMQRLLQNMA